ncbi:hypothetical protein ENUP19_0337G0018 [Entamoeba nuttalli]|uniref:Uncharacterized protein n=2 Tax=Entamoeba nuttalli TaxID=412467 RepID=K2HX78_ENTNP|nr:hypothetical protein ENU1_073940 [Entamoeba nuttalli P19]EKE40950.1 hypothetical protein ENU1_073940 [Entamoeba nuttalli P19]|eukprot:XP_008856711.1 hypothetical protein ENU1_073940 [Entamoeba nuttalli P19]
MNFNENTEEKIPQTVILTEEVNLGFGVCKCIEFLKTHGGVDDGVKEDDEIDLDRVDDLGRTIKPLEQYRMMCHRFHGKNPSKNKIKRTNKLRAQDILKLRMSFQDTPLGMINTAKKLMVEQHKPFLDVKLEKK